MTQEPLFSYLDTEQTEAKEAEFYPTPSWCVRVLVENIFSPLPYAGGWCEPAAGEGASISFWKTAS